MSIPFFYPTQKAALVWPDTGVHGKAAPVGIAGSTHLGSSLSNSGAGGGGRVSPGSGLVHWVSMMTDHGHGHMPSPAHTGSSHGEAVHYSMWTNGSLEGKVSENHHHHHHHGSMKASNGPTGDENRVGLDSSVHHSLYGSHATGRLINSGGGGGTGGVTGASGHGGHGGGQSMLIMSQPMKSLSSSNTSNGTGRKYQCKMCPQVFSSKADMQLHTQIHMREAKPYKCNQCSKAFANSSYLSQHTRIHLGIKPYKCEICMRKFTQLSHLQQHIRTHTGDKPYKCRHPGCNKAFSQLSNLQSHSRCHQTDKPFKCNSCYKCFVDEASLLEHIPKHKESKHLKTHICEFCGKSYTQETYLAKHMAKHADRLDKRGLLMRSVNQSLNSSLPPHSGGVGGSTGGVNSADPYSWGNKGDNSLCPPTDSSSAVQQHQQQQAQEAHNQSLGLSSSDPSRYGPSGGHTNGRSTEDMMYSQESQKSSSASSAFTPIQPMISSSSARSVAAAYFPYESFGFSASKGSSVGSMGEHPKSGAGHTAFPNQLIALHQIRNYASMPGSASSLAEIAAKDKQQ